MSVIPNPSPTELQNILVLAGFAGFIIILVIVLLYFVWSFGQVFAKSLG